MRQYSYVIILCLILTSFLSYAQKNDYIWLSGYDSYAHDDSALSGYEFGNTQMNFNYTPVQITYDSLSINFSRDNVTFSDNNGNLLFSSNAVYIFNSYNEEIENGDSLNAGFFQYVFDPTIQQYGYGLSQGILAFQDVSNTNYFYLLYTNYDTVGGTQESEAYCPKILTALLDMSANNGHGKVIYKDSSIINDNLGGELTATRHGNGRDWWVLVSKDNSNCYYRILIDTTGPHVLPDLTCGDSSVYYPDFGSVTFSPDGSKYVYFTIMKGLEIFDFDRCTGELSNPIHIPIDIWSDSEWIGSGVAISPNNRFLYLSATHYMVQYDLQASDIALSADTVGIYDGYYELTPAFSALFNTAQIAPDGKIYIGCGNSMLVYHVINNPDSLGSACDFEQHSVHLQTLSPGPPNYPNYRLSQLVGSVCDTIYTETNEVKIDNRERILKVFPNPATDIVTVDYGFTNWSAPGAVSLEIVNELGQPVYTQPVPEYSGYQRIDVTRYAPGIYTAYIKRNEQVIAAQKFAKE